MPQNGVSRRSRAVSLLLAFVVVTLVAAFVNASLVSAQPYHYDGQIARGHMTTTPIANVVAASTVRKVPADATTGLSVVAQARLLAAEDATNVFRAGDSAGGGGISLDQASAAASRNGINMDMFDLQYEPGPNFGFMSQTGSGALVRGAGVESS